MANKHRSISYCSREYKKQVFPLVWDLFGDTWIDSQGWTLVDSLSSSGYSNTAIDAAYFLYCYSKFVDLPSVEAAINVFLNYTPEEQEALYSLILLSYYENKPSYHKLWTFSQSIIKGNFFG